MTTQHMNTKFYQIVDLKDYRYESDCSDLCYGEIADDCDSKTVSLLDAIRYISSGIKGMVDNSTIDKEKIKELSSTISDLAEIAISTNKISQAATYLNCTQEAK